MFSEGPPAKKIRVGVSTRRSARGSMGGGGGVGGAPSEVRSRKRSR